MAYARLRAARTLSTESLTVQERPHKKHDLQDQEESASRSCSVFMKWTVAFILALAFLACIVFNKLSIVFISAHIYDLRVNDTHDVTGNESDVIQHKYGIESSMAFCIMLIILPYLTTLIRSLWCGALRSDRPFPSLAAFIWCLASSVAESLGVALFFLDLISHCFSAVAMEIPLMNAIFLLPICVQLFFALRGEELKKASLIRDIIALALSAGGAVAIFTFNSFGCNYTSSNNHHLTQVWPGPLGLLLVSFSWLPSGQRAQLEPTRTNNRQKIHRSKKYTQIAAAAARGHSTDLDLDNNSIQEEGEYEIITNGPEIEEYDPADHLLFALSNPEQSARWKVSLISNLLKLFLTPLFMLLLCHFSGILSIKTFWFALPNATSGHPLFCAFMVNLLSSFLGYLLGWVVCMLCVQGLSFGVPLILGGPLASIILWQLVGNSASLQFPKIAYGTQDRLAFQVPGPVCLYAAQVIFNGFFIFYCRGAVMQKDSRIFWLPGYNSLFLDQCLQLGRRILLVDDGDIIEVAKNTRVYICTTMYREAVDEMDQLIQSINRINKAKQTSDRHFQSHIFFDNGVRGKWLQPFALQLVSVVEKTLGVKSEDCTKVVTPYGVRLSWQLPSVLPGKSGMTLTVHMKDHLKVKKKKRWSQVMYMSYVLDYLMKEDDQAKDETTYILATDADVNFSPESVEALLDLMSRDTEVGAVCARTHPTGKGPMLWYQIFDYAIGHWLQRSTNHILGSVLCCPGCFSVYRAGALREVLPLYATNVKDSSEFLIKDMGEDRWLCTLMVQHGWRLEYCAAAENATFCPDNFDEFFNQRRRWIASTFANLTLLLQQVGSICRDNKHISWIFMLYQCLLLVSALISPSVCVLIISGGLFYAWDVSQAVSVTLVLLTFVIYTVICLNASQRSQLRVAKFLTIIFALVMAAVAIGTAIQIANESSGRSDKAASTISPIPPNTTTTTPMPTKPLHMPHPDLQIARVTMRRVLSNSDLGPPQYQRTWAMKQFNKGNGYNLPVSVTTMYLSGLVGIYVITALLHLPEAYCLLHGLWYLLCLPAGYLVLLIYALCNITDSSWGTREEKPREEMLQRSSFMDLILALFRRNGKSVQKVDKMVQTGEDPRRSSAIDGRGTPEVDSDQFESSSNYAFCSDRSTNFEGPMPVALWLPKSLIIYASKLEAAGFEDTSYLSGVTDWELRNVVGISSTFHRRAILEEVRKLPEVSISPGIPDRVDTWLVDIGLGAYAASFRRRHLLKGHQLEIIKTMDQDDIRRELHVTKPGHIKRLLKALRFLRYPTEGEKDRQRVASLLDSLDTHKLIHVNRREHDFWTALRHLTLMPEEPIFLEQQGTLSEGLASLRNNTLTVFAVVNIIWIILVLTLITKTELDVLHTNALGLAFLVIFGLVVLIQFLCMVCHRIGTWLHLVARAPFCCGSPMRTSWAFRDESLAATSTRDFTDSMDVEAARQRDFLTEELRRRRRTGPNYQKLENNVPESV